MVNRKSKKGKIDIWNVADWLIFSLFPAISLFFIITNNSVMQLIEQQNSFIGIGFVIAFVVLTIRSVDYFAWILHIEYYIS